MKHNIVVDYIRGVAIILIVTCHFLIFGGVRGWEPLGQWLAGIGNFLFFALSALLFGLQYNEKGSAYFLPLAFFKKRFMRLFPALWIFLLIWITIQIFVFKVYLDPLKIILNFLGFCWFAKLPDIGHLWFVTMIILCCIMICGFANKKMKFKIGGWIILLIISLFLELGLDSLGKPGYIFVILFYSLFFFAKASKIIRYAAAESLARILLMLVLSNGLALILSFHSDFLFAKSFLKFANCLAGFSWLVLMLRIGEKFRYYKSLDMMLLLVSSYSYELYLVHHIFCCGKLLVINFTECVLLNYGLLWICAICTAILIKILGDKIYKRLNVILYEI